MKIFIFFISLVFANLSFSQSHEMSTAFENNGYEKVVELGEQILENQSGNYNVFLLLGKAYNALNEFEKAIPLLRKANEYAEIEWQYAAAYVEIMEAYYAMGLNDTAKRYYNKGIHVRGSKGVQKKFQKLALLFGYDPIYNDWITVKTYNFVFHFEDIAHVGDIDNFIEDRIEAFKKINSFYNVKLPKEIDFFVWKSEGVVQKKFKKFLSFTNPKYCVSHNKLDQTVGHEIAHTISYWYDKNNHRNRFINEGIGVYFDCSETNRISTAKEIINYQRKINNNFNNYDIRIFWTNPNKYPEHIMYPIAGAFVEMLVNHNTNKFLELTKDQSYENALNIYGRGGLDRLISNFNEELNDFEASN